MSLVSEALKKAHLEAVRQERQPVYRFRSPGSVDFPAQARASRRKLISVIVLSNVSVVAVGAFVVFMLMDGRDSAAVPSAATAAMGIAAPLPVPAPAPPPDAKIALAPAASNAAAEVAPSAVKKPRKTATATKAQSQVPLIAEKRETTSQSEDVSSPDPAPRTAPIRLQRVGRRYGLMPGQTYARSLRTDEGTELTLFGISSARGRSVALINGGVVGEGEEVDGFTVGRIAFGKVELRYRDITVFMTLQ